MVNGYAGGYLPLQLAGLVNSSQAFDTCSCDPWPATADFLRVGQQYLTVNGRGVQL